MVDALDPSRLGRIAADVFESSTGRGVILDAEGLVIARNEPFARSRREQPCLPGSQLGDSYLQCCSCARSPDSEVLLHDAFQRALASPGSVADASYRAPHDQRVIAVRFHGFSVFGGGALAMEVEADPEVDAESDATYRRVVEQTEDLLVRMSVDYTVLFISPGVREVLGFDPEDCIGASAAKPAVSRDPWEPNHQELLNGGKITLTAPFNHRDGSVRWLSTTITGVSRYPGGPVVELLALARDVTRMHEAEVELERSRSELQRLARRLEHVREDERTGLARELHDELLQPLAGLKLELDWLAEHSDAPALRPRLEQLGKRVAPLVERTRRLSVELRPVVLDELGLAAAIEAEVDALRRRTGSALRVSLKLDEISPEPERDRALLRIVREALSNVERHANAASVEVRLKQADDGVRLEVRDDGDGFDVDAHDRAGVGLVAMRERALAAGGRLVLHRGSAGGTLVGADFPAY